MSANSRKAWKLLGTGGGVYAMGALGLPARTARCKGGRWGPGSWRGGALGWQKDKGRDLGQAGPGHMELAITILMAKARQWHPGTCL